MDSRISPTVRRRRLAMQLRRLRAEAGIKASDVAEELCCSPGKISQMETGRVSITVPDTKAMLDLYGVNGAQRDALIELARTAKQRGWWLPYSEVMPPGFQQLVGLETESSAQRIFQTDYVPGLLQTEEYLLALRGRDLHPWSDEELDQIVALHRSRQAILTGDDAPRFWFILDEAVLRRFVGSPEIMSGQLSRLLETGRRENVTVQVLPFSAGAHDAMTRSFTLLEFPEPGDTDVVHMEYLTGALYIEHEEEAAPYRLAFEDLMASALSKAKSAVLIRQLAMEL